MPAGRTWASPRCLQDVFGRLPVSRLVRSVWLSRCGEPEPACPVLTAPRLPARLGVRMSRDSGVRQCFLTQGAGRDLDQVRAINDPVNFFTLIS